MLQSRVVLVLRLERCHHLLDGVELHEVMADLRRLLRERVDEEHRLDDEFLLIARLNQRQQTFEAAHVDEGAHARLVASHDAGDGVKRVAGHFRLVRHQLDQSGKDVELE